VRVLKLVDQVWSKRINQKLASVEKIGKRKDIYGLGRKLNDQSITYNALVCKINTIDSCYDRYKDSWVQTTIAYCHFPVAKNSLKSGTKQLLVAVC